MPEMPIQDYVDMEAPEVPPTAGDKLFMLNEGETKLGWADPATIPAIVAAQAAADEALRPWYGPLPPTEPGYDRWIDLDSGSEYWWTGQEWVELGGAPLPEPHADDIPASNVGHVELVGTNVQLQLDQADAELVTRVSKTGDTMSGVLNMGAQRITNMGAATGIDDAVRRRESEAYTEAYVDNEIGQHLATPNAHPEYVSQSGDTMTGVLAFNGDFYFNRQIEFRSGGVRQTDILENTEGGYFAIRKFNSAGTVVMGAIEMAPSGTVTISSAVGLAVPPVSGPTQAAQVTAYNATTGQRQIAGVEVGDTGLRNIDGLLGTDWVVIAGEGGVILRRSGNTVQFSGQVQTGATPAASMLSLPAGFRPINAIGYHSEGFLVRAENDVQWESFSQWYRIRSYDGYVFPVWKPMAPWLAYVRWSHTFMTGDAWPTTLPGVAA